MKDQNKIKERDNKGDFKVIILIGVLFLVSFGLIIYGITKLTKQYFSLKDQLSEKSAIEKSHIQPDDNNQQINLQSGDVKVEAIKKDIKEAMGENLSKEDNRSPNAEKQNIKTEIVLDADKEKQTKNKNEPQKVDDKTETKTKIEDKTKNEQKDIKVAKKDDIKNETKKQPENLKKEPVKTEPKKDSKIEAKTKIEEKIKGKTDTNLSKKDDNQKIDKKVTENLSSKDDKSSSKPATTGVFALQLMAFKEQSVAEKEAEKLKSKIKDVYIEKADLGEKGVWYRVRCCISSTEAELKAKKDKVKTETGLNPIPVRR